MKGKRLQLLATALILLAIVLIAKPWDDSVSDPLDSSGRPAPDAGEKREVNGSEPSVAGSTRSPIVRSEPFEASEEVAILLGEEYDDTADVVGRLKDYVDDSSKPMSARHEAMTHLLNLSSAEEMEGQLLEFALRPSLAREFRSAIVAESLNHSPEFRGDLLISLLENPALGAEQEALEGLRELVGKDLGVSPADWRAALAR